MGKISSHRYFIKICPQVWAAELSTDGRRTLFLDTPFYSEDFKTFKHSKNVDDLIHDITLSTSTYRLCEKLKISQIIHSSSLTNITHIFVSEQTDYVFN